jgi:hypothetical protein
VSAELLEALRPFALYAEQMAERWGQSDNSAFYGIKRPGAHQITYGDFRRAAKVYRAARNAAEDCGGDFPRTGEKEP